MLPVLVGNTNRTNLKKPNTQRGSFSTTVQDSEHTQHTKRGRKKLRPFFLRIVRKGKRKYKDNARRQRKTTRAKKDNEHKRKANTRTKRENERQTRHKSYNRLTPHAHKSPTIHAKHQDNTNPRQAYKTALKTPLKREIEPYLQAMHQGKSCKTTEHTTRGPEPTSFRS